MQIRNSYNKYDLKNLFIASLLILIIGTFLSFVFLAQTNSPTHALLIGFFNAILLVLVMVGVHHFIISKLKVFSLLQQWTIRTFIYVISLSAVYMTGLLFKSAILAPDLSWKSFIGEKLWTGFVTFISSPLDLEFADISTKEEFRALLIPFFAVIMLIGLVSLIGSYIDLRWQQNKQHLIQERAELNALRAQIEPHFLFNSLNTIASQIDRNPQKAERLIVMLSDILRHIFDTVSKEMILLTEEITFLENYCALMQARYESRLKIDWQIVCSNKQIEIPALLLQPIIENSLRHGWRKNSEKLRLKIVIEDRKGLLTITIADDGQGIDAEQLKKIPLAGHALANIYARLRLLYNRKDLIQIDSDPAQGTTVTIKIPVGKR
jgi:sensor histidine kinase YesM